jgi:drug/metabolite transporter (DMT)-like permease
MSTVPAVKATKPKTAFYFVLLALASLIWSGQGIAVKVLDPHLGPIAITFLPFYVTTLLCGGRTRHRLPPPQEIGSASPSPGSVGRCWRNWE